MISLRNAGRGATVLHICDGPVSSGAHHRGGFEYGGSLNIYRIAGDARATL
jgi:hypothetical protein